MALRELGTSISVPATPAGSSIFDQMLVATESALCRLERMGGLRPEADAEWRALQVLSVVVGPLLMEPVMQRHLREPAYSADAVRRRTEANVDFVAHGLFAGSPARLAR